LRIGTEGAERRIIDKILIPFSINMDNVDSNISHNDYYQNIVDLIKEFFANFKIDESLDVDKINKEIDTLPGVSLELDKITGFYYYDNNEDVMKNSPKIEVPINSYLYINPEDVFFSMDEFNPNYGNEVEEE
jgi:hypothetical protein